jgi:hypothetical protein
MPADMHEIAPAPGLREISHDATKKASHVSSGMRCVDRGRKPVADDSIPPASN